MLSLWVAITASMLYLTSVTAGSLTPVYMAFTPAIRMEAKNSENVTVRASYSQTQRQHTALKNLDQQQTGRIEIHWQFASIDKPCDGGCGTVPCICPTPQYLIFFEWYANGVTTPTCTDQIDITADTLAEQLNGKAYYSINCDIYTIFDGPNPNEGAVQTYGSGHGVDCGWVTSPDHTSSPGILGYSEDFYFHCAW